MFAQGLSPDVCNINFLKSFQGNALLCFGKWSVNLFSLNFNRKSTPVLYRRKLFNFASNQLCSEQVRTTAFETETCFKCLLEKLNVFVFSFQQESVKYISFCFLQSQDHQQLLSRNIHKWPEKKKVIDTSTLYFRSNRFLPMF